MKVQRQLFSHTFNPHDPFKVYVSNIKAIQALQYIGSSYRDFGAIKLGMDIMSLIMINDYSSTKLVEGELNQLAGNENSYREQ